MRRPIRLGTAAPQGSGVALGALIVLVVGSLALVALDVAASPLGKRSVVAGLTVLVLMPALMLGQYAPPPYRLPYRWRWGLLLVQAVLTYLPLLLFHYRWLSLLGFLAGAVLLTLPPGTSVPLALAVGASGPLLAATGLIDTNRSPLSVLLGTAITASTVFAVAHLALLTARLHGSREQAAHLAEQRERARMQQDLHDLVGSSLTAIALQGESALRGSGTPTGSGPERAALTEIITLARRLHDDVRSISRPDGGLSLSEELAHAQRVLNASGVEVRTVLPPRTGAAPAVVGCLRFVLREAVGNVLQHSAATYCEITLRADGTAIRLTVRNDGAERGEAGSPVPGQRHGTGLAGLRGRVLALGGEFTAGAGGGVFTLTAAVPSAGALADRP
ncbi:two-component sensor histidine kinase [Streptomyces sp. SID8374]|uniref:sensor histidine kinase n=1 Tax=Streptomyces sp. SID8374 TaxID=2690354 RepID=UPI001367DFDA|nr:histidine kinase [Streptomyces sp. SID8374]MYX15885.1 two-component sensor histidine kinase [Streptomyces sp. SID8374]